VRENSRVQPEEMPSVSVAQMREIDRLMVEELGITLEQMMENAGRALAELARRALGDLSGRRVTVLAGPGGNGGGALVAARRMRIWGAVPTVALASPAEGMHHVPAHQLAIARQMEIEVVGPDAPVPDLGRSALVLDGLYGYSLDGPPRGRGAELILAANASGIPILALDVPSGLSADTGEPFAPTIRARQTLALALPKTGLRRSSARPYVGELLVADISVPAALYRRLGLAVGPIFARGDIVPVSSSPAVSG
jgi:NAD(P)H-hydrate epimerase